MKIKKLLILILFFNYLQINNLYSNEIPKDANGSSKQIYLNQSWEEGIWRKVESQPEMVSYMPLPILNGRRVGFSVCEFCNSVRIVDLEKGLEKIILFSEKDGKHDWQAALHTRCKEILYDGDVIVAFIENQLRLIRIKKINIDDNLETNLVYEVSDSIVEEQISLNKLKWQENEAKEQIEFGQYSIPFVITVNTPPYISIDYSRVYGGVSFEDWFGYTPPYFKSKLPPIAIVHKKELQNDIVDVKQYRFKMWEDGLGNKIINNEQPTSEDLKNDRVCSNIIQRFKAKEQYIHPPLIFICFCVLISLIMYSCFKSFGSYPIKLVILLFKKHKYLGFNALR